MIHHLFFAHGKVKSFCPRRWCKMSILRLHSRLHTVPPITNHQPTITNHQSPQDSLAPVTSPCPRLICSRPFLSPLPRPQAGSDPASEGAWSISLPVNSSLHCRSDRHRAMIVAHTGKPCIDLEFSPAYSNAIYPRSDVDVNLNTADLSHLTFLCHSGTNPPSLFFLD